MRLGRCFRLWTGSDRLKLAVPGHGTRTPTLAANLRLDHAYQRGNSDDLPRDEPIAPPAGKLPVLCEGNCVVTSIGGNYPNHDDCRPAVSLAAPATANPCNHSSILEKVASSGKLDAVLG